MKNVMQSLAALSAAAVLQSASLRLMSSLRICVMAFAATLMLGGCAGNEAEEDAFVRDIAQAYEKAQQSLNNGNYRRAIQIYEALQARFPFSEFATQIQLELAYAYYKAGQKEQAIDASDTFVRENPTHPRVDYALYVKGLTYFDQDVGSLEKLFRRTGQNRPPVDAQLSFSTFKRLVERYPASPYAQDSRQRMIYLKNRLAAYENSVARYYIKRGAYVAAANRAKTALEEYHGADSGAESLQLLIQAYDKLGMTELAADARKVLRENFPDERS
ncbi:MAG: outer membrane protein assembly factor BamD [Gammaproteobacteria bacterium]|nr:outer membrane protein assembly factor BamD [Gammaproteobacteria bacterium]